MARHALALLLALFVSAVVVSADDDDATRTDKVVAEVNSYIDSNKGYPAAIRIQFRRLPRETVEELLKDQLKSKDPEVLKRALSLAELRYVPGVCKQAEKLAKSKDPEVSTLALMVILGSGDGRQRTKALASYVDGPDRASGNGFNHVLVCDFSEDFADALQSTLSKEKTLGESKEFVLTKWLGNQLGRPDLGKGDLLEQYKALKKKQEELQDRQEVLIKDLEYELVSMVPSEEFGHTRVSDAWLTKDGTKVLVMVVKDAREGTTVRCFEFDTGEKLFETPNIDGMSSQIVGLRDEENEIVVMSDKTLQRYSTEDGSLKSAVTLKRPGTPSVLCSGGKEAVLYDDRSLWVVNVDTGETARELYSGEGRPFHLAGAPSPDGKSFVACIGHANSKEFVTRVFDISSGKKTAEFPNAGECIGITNAGELLLHDNSKNVNVLVDGETGKVRLGINLPAGSISLPRRPLDQWCIAEDDDAVCKLISLETGRVCATIRPPCTHPLVDDKVQAPQCSVDGSRVVVVRAMYLPELGKQGRILCWRRKQ